jgi:hypothetical protein
MKVISKIGLVLGVCAIVASLPASAVCGLADNRSFGGYLYLQGSTGTTADLLGSFWIVGSPGTNNGSYGPDIWAVQCSGGGCPTGGDGSFYLAGNWAQAGVNGCPAQAANVAMAFQISAPGAGGGSVYGGGCIQSTGDFNFGSAGVGLPMQPIPKASVNTSSRVGDTAVSITVAAPNVPGGILDEGSCGLAPQSYRVYSKVVPRNGPAPTDRGRVSGGWALAGSNTIGNPTTVNVGCNPANPDGGEDVYLGLTVVLNDGQEVGHVGANSTVVQCGAINADRPTDFKIIKKPIRRPTNQQ